MSYIFYIVFEIFQLEYLYILINNISYMIDFVDVGRFYLRCCFPCFYFIFFTFLIKSFFIVILLQLSQFFLLCPPLPIWPRPPTPTPTVNSHTVVQVPGSFIHAPCLIPSPSFHHYSHPPSPITFNLFYVSTSVVVFCSLVYLVHKIPLIGEIIWYLSFTNWLISLSIIVSSSIHAVTTR